MGLFSFIRELQATASHPTCPPGRSTDDELVAANYHRRVVRFGYVFAGIGFALALLGTVAAVVLVGPGPRVGVLLITPVAYGAGGFLYGMAVACLFAPRAFLTGPVGRRWMRLIGTKSVTVARAACFVFWLVVTVVTVGWLGLIVWGALGGR